MLRLQSFITIVFLLVVFLSIAQEKSSKSSYKKLPPAEINLQKAEDTYEKNPKSALLEIEKALKIAIGEKNVGAEAQAYFLLGKINFNQSLYEQAVADFSKARILFARTGNENQLWESEKMLALSLEKSNRLQEAEIVYQRLLDQAEKKNDTGKIIDTRSSLGRVSGEKGDYSKALNEYEKVLDLEESRQNTTGVIHTNKAIGEVFEKQNKNREALEFYSRSEELARHADDAKSVISASKNIKEVYRKEGRIEDELSLRLRSLSEYERKNNLSAAGEEYNQIATLYLKQNNPEKALEYLNIGLTTSIEGNDSVGISRNYLLISEAHRMRSDYRNALRYYEKYVGLTDTLRRDEQAKLTGQIKLNEELSLRQKKIEFLEKDLELNNQELTLLYQERKLQRLLIYFLTALILMLGITGFVIFRISRKRRKMNLMLALRSLRAQMNPHFIFNALNSVNSFIAQSDERAANKYLADFSRLMRDVMENSEHDFIPLSTEIRILQLYLNLEHTRFKEKFRYELHIDPSLDMDAVFLPPMLVQPYVENAVWHGLRYLDKPGFLNVSFTQEEQGLLIKVEDNGIGRQKSQELKTANQKTRISTGLKNTANRVRLINELHQTSVKISVSDPENGNGTIVQIIVPISQYESSTS